MQTNWIGRSEGAEVAFATEAGPIEVFTTRPDTLWGATFMVLAPEHPLVPTLTTDAQRADVEAYQAAAARLSDIDRQAEGKTKTGVFTGAYATNPVTQEQVPVWIADYVLTSYGTGAVMAVPAHDQRDFEFARTFGLEVRVVVQPEGVEALDDATMSEAFAGDGVLVRSAPFDGLRVGKDAGKDGIARIVAWLDEQGLGRGKVTYRLRDWLISRQRYWGTPIPVVYCDACGIGSRGRAAGRLPDRRRVHPDRPVAAGHARGLPGDDLPLVRRSGAARDRHHGHLHGLVLVLVSLHLAAQRTRSRSMSSGLPWTPVDLYMRRRGARDLAPDLRALLHQGAARLGSGRSW